MFLCAAAQLEYAEWLILQDRAAEAQPILDEATGTFEQLEATPWTERARQALSKVRAAVGFGKGVHAISGN